ncbi:MAG: large repetitive protein, partial [Chloroflexota bacterium]|nr:large repetitive protein [Chloroflexota bacterium]
AVGTLTFPPGTSTRTVSVPVTASTIHTGDRAFVLTLNTPIYAVMGQSQAFATIIDPTFNPVLVVDDAAVLKPSSGTATLTSTVHLYPASPNTVTVNYTTANYTAAAGTDYVATSGTLTFAPGDTSKTIPVTVNGSGSSVPDRQFQVNLNTPSNAQLPGRNGAWGVIVDTVAPTSGLSYLMVQDAAVLKPNSGTATESFNVKLFPAATSPINVNYQTSDYTAVAGAGDYVAARGTLTFAPSVTSQTVNVTVNGNTMPASDKLLQLGLASNTGPSSVLRGSSYGSILSQQVDSRLSVGPDITINRGTSDSQNVSFSVSLNSPQQFPVQVDYTTNDGNTYAPEGYTPESGTLLFAAGQTTQSVVVNVPGNPAFTGVQYFYFDLSNPTNSSLGFGASYRETVYIYNLDTFAITGKVIDTTGAGLAGVTVTRTGNFAPARAVTTAADGSFTILNTINGVYTVTPTLGGSAFVPANMSVTVRGTSMTAGPFLAYAGTGITGLVADSAGKAKAGVTVTRTGGGAATVITTTDSLGYYAFGSVAAGTGYVVTPTLNNFSFNPASYTFNVAGTTIKSQDFVALQGVIISGQVTFAGAGVSGVTITRTGGGAPTATVKTNSQGYYGISNNPATVSGVTYTITPTKTGKTFTPPSASANVTTTVNATGVNFTQN